VPTTLRPNRRPMLIVGGTRVPELACYRVGCDGVLMAVRLSRAALRLLAEPVARAFSASW
jgi:transposase